MCSKFLIFYLINSFSYFLTWLLYHQWGSTCLLLTPLIHFITKSSFLVFLIIINHSELKKEIVDDFGDFECSHFLLLRRFRLLGNHLLPFLALCKDHLMNFVICYQNLKIHFDLIIMSSDENIRHQRNQIWW